MSESQNGGMTRRTVLRRSAAAAGGLAAGGAGAYRFGAVRNARACPICIAAGGVAVGAAGVALYSHYAGDDNDTQAVLGAIQFEDHLDSYNRFREWWEVENEVQLASFENDLNNLHNQLLNNGIRTLYEQALEGADEASAISTAKSDMDADADEVAEWIISWWNARCESSAMSTLHDLGKVYTTKDSTSTEYVPAADAFTDIHTYLLPGSGNSVDTSFVRFEDGSGAWHGLAIVNQSDELADFQNGNWSHTAHAVEPNPENYSFDTEEYDGPEDFDGWEHVDGDQKGLDARPYVSLLQKIEDKLATAKTDLDNVASDHFTAIQEGDVSLSELMAPGGLLATAGDADTAHEAALYFRATDMPHTEGLEIEAENPETGEDATMEGYLGWSVADDGDTLPIGEVINPANRLGSIYFATQYYDEEQGETIGDVLELTQPFTITTAEEGTDSVTFDAPASVADADTDPSQTIKIFRENRDSEQEARDMTIEVVKEETSGGGGFSFGGSGFSIPTLIGKIAGFPIWLIAVVVALIYNKLSE